MRPPFRKWASEGAAEFHLCRPENLLFVRTETDGGVSVRATADNLSAEHREAFVRYLVTEGFVPNTLSEPPVRSPAWLSKYSEWPVRWIVDPTWPEVDPVYVKYLQRLCWYLGGVMMTWLALMAVLVFYDPSL